MTARTEAALLASLRENPYDEAALLVYADALQARGDPRGELLLLQHHEDVMPAGLADPAALERFLVLAAQHGFPRVPDDPDDAFDLLPFDTVFLHEPHYVHPVGATLTTRWEGRHYVLQVDRHLTVRVDNGPATLHRLYLEHMSEDDLHLIATVMSASIRSGEAPAWPVTVADWERHPARRLGRVPVWPVPAALEAAHAGLRLRVHARDKKRWFELWERLQRLR